jgi:ABC-type Fe3+ transport system substrate-binding protein
VVLYVVFAVAIMAISKEQEAAKAFIKFVISPQAGPLLQKGMMEPACADDVASSQFISAGRAAL